MRAKQISGKFPSGKIGEEEAVSYLKEQSLYEELLSIARSQGDRIKPKFRDLARLHSIVRQRKCLTVLEFGVGFSTLVLADALQKNKTDWAEADDLPEIREAFPFSLHSVDSGDKWIEATKNILTDRLKDLVQFYNSPVKVDHFNGKMCHFYEQLPDVVPDFIYIDGPDPATVKGEINGQSWNNPARVVMSADLLLIEPFLMPGTLVLFDGRTLNARFLASHIYRNWDIYRTEGTDVTAMELCEMPLGQLNLNLMKYQLGDSIHKWSEPLNRLKEK